MRDCPVVNENINSKSGKFRNFLFPELWLLSQEIFWGKLPVLFGLAQSQKMDGKSFCRFGLVFSLLSPHRSWGVLVNIFFGKNTVMGEKGLIGRIYLKSLKEASEWVLWTLLPLLEALWPLSWIQHLLIPCDSRLVSFWHIWDHFLQDLKDFETREFNFLIIFFFFNIKGEHTCARQRWKSVKT